jgi:hypothetical protein
MKSGIFTQSTPIVTRRFSPPETPLMNCGCEIPSLQIWIQKFRIARTNMYLVANDRILGEFQAEDLQHDLDNFQFVFASWRSHELE